MPGVSFAGREAELPHQLPGPRQALRLATRPAGRMKERSAMLRCSVRLGFALAAIVLSPVPQASGYEVVTVSNGGTIQGRVTFTGPPPPPRKEVRTKNPEV